MKKNLYIILLCFLCLSLSEIQAENRWNINPDGSITWKLREKDAHQDHIEMSGLKYPPSYGMESTKKAPLP